MLTQQAKLRWQCRRGMLELDLLLFPFLEQAFMNLPANEQALFADLLSCTDQELYDWLIKQQRPTDENLALMVKKVQQHAQA